MKRYQNLYACFGTDFIFPNKCAVVIDFLINQFFPHSYIFHPHIFFLSSFHAHASILLLERYAARYRLYKKLPGTLKQIYPESICTISLFPSTLNWLFLISPIKIPFTDDSNLHEVSFLRANPFRINLHDFIIVMPRFFEVYGARYRLDSKSSGTLICPSSPSVPHLSHKNPIY